MKLRRVESFLLSYRFPEPVELDYYGGRRTIVKRDAMLVRVEADNGLAGWGPGPASERVQQTIENRIRPFLEGRSVEDLDALRTEFFAVADVGPVHQKVYRAVELALYDLLGKARGVPVSELIGGRRRDMIRLYGSAGMYQSPEGYAREAAGVAGLGFDAYKMRPALGPQGDLRAVRLMREAVGPDVELMVDAHTWWRMGDRSYPLEVIEDLARELGELDVCWLEEPLPPRDHTAYRELHKKGLVPLASGEHEQTEEGFLDLVETRAVDYVQADVVCQGGYGLGTSLLPAIERAGLKFAFHSWGTDLEVIAAAHLGVCWPESVVAWLEYPVYSTDRLKTMYPFPLAREILDEPLDISNGWLRVPSKPGLGVEIDPDVIDKYPWVPGPWSSFSLISPPGTWSVSSDHSLEWADRESDA